MYNLGDEQVFGYDTEEYELLEEVAHILTDKNKRRHVYVVRDVLYSVKSNKFWTSIVNWTLKKQALSPQFWLDIVNKVDSPYNLAFDYLNSDLYRDMEN